MAPLDLSVPAHSARLPSSWCCLSRWFPTGGVASIETHNTARNRAKGQGMAKNTICLWYDKDAEAAARFYAETFPNSAVGTVHRAPGDYPSGKKGDVLTVEFT